MHSKSTGIHRCAMSRACFTCFLGSSARKQRATFSDSVQRWQSCVAYQTAYDVKLNLSHHRHAYAQLRRQPDCGRRCAQHAHAASTEEAVESSAAAEEVSIEDVDAESAQLLDWPAVCAQVAAFTSTPAAVERVLSSGLPLGTSLVRQPLLLGVWACLLRSVLGALTVLPC